MPGILGAHDEDCCPAGDGKPCQCDCHFLDHAHCWEIVGLMRAVNHNLDVQQLVGLSRQELRGASSFESSLHDQSLSTSPPDAIHKPPTHTTTRIFRRADSLYHFAVQHA